MKEIEKKIKLFNELKELDAKIIELEKIAIDCNNGAENLKITLSCDKIKEAKKEDVLDSDGSLKTGCSMNSGYIYGFTYTGFTIQSNDSKKENELSISETVEQKHFFMFLNYMLDGYNKRREFLINKLNQ